MNIADIISPLRHRDLTYNFVRYPNYIIERTTRNNGIAFSGNEDEWSHVSQGEFEKAKKLYERRPNRIDQTDKIIGVGEPQQEKIVVHSNEMLLSVLSIGQMLTNNRLFDDNGHVFKWVSDMPVESILFELDLGILYTKEEMLSLFTWCKKWGLPYFERDKSMHEFIENFMLSNEIASQIHDSKQKDVSLNSFISCFMSIYLTFCLWAKLKFKNSWTPNVFLYTTDAWCSEQLQKASTVNLNLNYKFSESKSQTHYSCDILEDLLKVQLIDSMTANGRAQHYECAECHTPFIRYRDNNILCPQCSKARYLRSRRIKKEATNNASEE